MARDNRTKFISGDYNLICHVCGAKIKASQSRLRWDGVLVCPEDWEPRHPQEMPTPIIGDPRALKLVRPDKKIDDEVFHVPQEWETQTRNWEDYDTDNWEDWG